MVVATMFPCISSLCFLACSRIAEVGRVLVVLLLTTLRAAVGAAQKVSFLHDSL